MVAILYLFLCNFKMSVVGIEKIQDSVLSWNNEYISKQTIFVSVFYQALEKYNLFSNWIGSSIRI